MKYLIFAEDQKQARWLADSLKLRGTDYLVVQDVSQTHGVAAGTATALFFSDRYQARPDYYQFVELCKLKHFVMLVIEDQRGLRIPWKRSLTALTVD